jgi:ankyrin repeat protein
MPLILVWEPGTLGHYKQALRSWWRRLLRSRIFDAIQRGDREVVLRLGSSRVLQNARDEFGRRPVSASIVAKQSPIAVALVNAGGYVRGDGAVSLAVLSQDVVVLRKLIERGADLNEPLPPDPVEKGYTPLMWATNRHNFEAMKLLLSAGADVNAKASDGTTAVMCASAGTDDDLVALDLLCAHKPQVTIKDWRGRTIVDEARDRARFSKKPAMLEILQRHYGESVANET